MSDPSQSTRRSFLATTGASIASLLSGCLDRQPPEDIVPYVYTPEVLVPGRPLCFASAVPLAGYAYGVLVESHEGRPSKIEGHPDHPSSLGATDAIGQALIRDFVDDSRIRGPRFRGQACGWAAVEDMLGELASAGGATGILSGRITSPTTAHWIEELCARRPGSRWYAWEPLAETNRLAGTRAALGRPLHPVARLEGARVVVSLDDDFLAEGPGRLAYARAFARARGPQVDDEAALRLYAIESFPTLTGAAADHCLSARHSGVEELARQLLAELRRGGPPRGRGWVELAAADLRRVGPAALVLAGERQPPATHAIAHTINHLLGSAGGTVEYFEPFTRGPVAGVHSLAELAASLRAGELETLIVLDDLNPVYDAPPQLELAQALSEAPRVIVHGLRETETTRMADWLVPAAHPLESWADARGHDGTPTLSQPLTRPLFGGRTAPELLAALLGRRVSARELVRETWRGRAPSEAQWQRAVHDGRLPRELTPVATSLQAPVELAPAHGEAGPSAREAEAPLELAFRPDPSLVDGRFASNPWLQELPKPITSLAWGNAVFVASKTAARLGLADRQAVRVRLGERSVIGRLRIQPGHPRGQVTVHLGHGRRVAGEVGSGRGFDAYALRGVETPWVASGVTLEPLVDGCEEGRGCESLIFVQHHHRLEGYALVRETSRARYRALGAAAFGPKHEGEVERPPSLHPDRPRRSPSWGMAIDLGACIGCNACVIACQAENNIPTVGPEEVRKGREMHWIRVDSYRQERPDGSIWTAFEPVPCMQCEHAPCEVVCPTGATVHSDSGLNDMVYNRCVGTRYCANNCPYKVRRFNFFAYSAREPELLTLSANPDVSVRSRGVMEKCTYCVQRLHGARRAARRKGRALVDGEVRTACQQACPTRAIEFGDVGDPDSAVSLAKAEPRSYALLAELGTRPRTTYLGRLRNPQPPTKGPRE